MHKRIRKELNDIIPTKLFEQNLNYEVYRCDYYTEEKTSLLGSDAPPVKIDIVNKKSKFIILQINFPNCYPFKPPYVIFSPYINPINYNKLLANNSNNKKFSKDTLFASLFFSICYNPHFYKTNLFTELILTNSCLCCSSITCPDNWYPGLGVSDIIKEYCLYKIFKKYRSNFYLKIFDKLFHNSDYNFPDEIILLILEKIGNPIDSNISKIKLH